MSHVHLVMRGHAGGWAVPQLSFADAEMAAQHATDATAATGVEHHVVTVGHAEEVPASSQWHRMANELSIEGEELWRQESDIVQFDEHPDAIREASMSWQVSIRYTPSQPPCRVRVVLVGPDRQWCLERADSVWDLAAGSPEFLEAAEIEAMLRENFDESADES